MTQEELLIKGIAAELLRLPKVNLTKVVQLFKGADLQPFKPFDVLNMTQELVERGALERRGTLLILGGVKIGRIVYGNTYSDGVDHINFTDPLARVNFMKLVEDNYFNS